MGTYLDQGLAAHSKDFHVAKNGPILNQFVYSNLIQSQMENYRKEGRISKITKRSQGHTEQGLE